MFEITEKISLNAFTDKMTVKAPAVAAKALPGQFVIIRADEFAERIPLTVADYDRAAGTVTVIFQKVGMSTQKLGALKSGDAVQDFVGPLGTPSHLDGLKRVAVVGGGLGCAIAYPQAKYLHEAGAEVDMIVGFRNRDLVILEEEMRAACTNLIMMTDDGSQGEKGFVTDALKARLEQGIIYDEVIAIGPPVMMKFVALLTKQYGVKTIVSMNPIMIDGTGMCGGCRVTVGGKVKFACVDGPEFDGHEVDFDELIRRNSAYAAQEREASHRYDCNLMKQAEEK
ncbi:MAG: sulfide/dihydroorotate dehydrogenase-like FAD/NAD-binding protein [Clostridia bacterium]|jgi:ferredoxin--NADP+ reductase|nr:sulfide/dihydroorotate dehydrogenase-like FAD/NAD-binding protein [Clostridia bacterium]